MAESKNIVTTLLALGGLGGIAYALYQGKGKAKKPEAMQ